MELTIDHVLFPSHRSQNNNNSISANSSIHGGINADDQSNISTLVAPQDDEKPHKKVHDSDNTGGATSSGKKPRHRHSPTQLAALNELYEKTEHPNLDDRIELAEKLGMETTAVNAWFQNKRASTYQALATES